MKARLLSWLERKNFISVHAFTLYLTLYLTNEAFSWAARYALATHMTSGVEAAAVIGAVTAPVTALQIYVFKTYSASRGNPHA